MTGALLQIDIKTDAIAAAFAQAAERAEDKQALMEGIGAALLLSTQMRFEEEAGPDGTVWPKSLRVKLQGGKTLRDSGRLYQSLTYRASSDEVEVGTNLIYGAIHQFGGTIRAKNGKALYFGLPGVEGLLSRKSVTIPARPYLGIDQGDIDEIDAQATDWMAGLFDETSGGAQ